MKKRKETFQRQMRRVRVGNMDMGEGSREIKRKGERGDKREANHCTIAKWSTL